MIIKTILSFAISLDEVSNWTYFTDVLNLLISIVTLLIAFKIFNRFSFKNKVLEKQFENVSDLISVLQNWTIAIETKGLDDGEDYFSKGWRVKFFDFKKLKKSKNHKELFFDEKLLFTHDWFENHPLNGLDNNPFMPKKIAQKIQDFKIWLPIKASSDNFKKVTRISLDYSQQIGKPKAKYPNSNIIEGFNFDAICNPNEKCFQNFETFHKMCEDLIEEIENWLKKYNAGNLNLK